MTQLVFALVGVLFGILGIGVVFLWPLLIIIVDSVLGDQITVLLFRQLDQIQSIGFLLLFETLHGCVHVNGESDNDVEADDDAEIVEDYEEVAIDQFAAHNVDTHLHDDIPIIDDNQNEQSDIGRHQIIEIDKVVVVGDGGICNNFGAVRLDFAAENYHANLGEHIKNGHHDNNQIVEWAKQVLQCLEDYAHYLDLVEQCQQLKHADENNHFENLHRVIILLEVVICFEVFYHGWQVEDLTQGLRPDPKVIPVGLHRSRDKDIADRFEEHDQVDAKLHNDPSLNIVLSLRPAQSSHKDCEDVENGDDVHDELVGRSRNEPQRFVVDAQVVTLDRIDLVVRVEVLHGALVLLFVEPSLVRNQQIDHFLGVHVPAPVSVKQRKNLLELHLCHIYLVAFFVEAVAQ